MKNIKFILQSVSLFILILPAAHAWEPPIGIPRPSFGIEETYRMYDDPANRNSTLTYTQNSEHGFFTHYIDNTHPMATDTDNSFGTPSIPRNTIPRGLPAGSVVEVHGGPYDYTNGGDKLYIDGIGTADRPVFVRGVNSPEFRRRIHIIGEYVILESIYTYDAGISIRDADSSNPIHHISIRHSEIEGDGTTGGSTGIGMGDMETNDIVISNNHIHHNGDYAYIGENDKHGVATGTNSHYVWIVDNHIHHNGGDSYQGGHSAAYSVTHVYIGRNEMHDDGENAIDLKDVTDIIVSQNRMYNYPREKETDANGVITVTHYGKNSLGTQRAWYLFNEMYNAERRAAAVSGGADEIYFIGNIVHDIGEEAFKTWQSGNVYFVNNTMYRIGIGIDSEGPDASIGTIVNNIFGQLNNPNPTSYHIRLDYSVYRQNAIVNHNLFQDPMNLYQNSSCYDCREVDPQFVDAEKSDFHLQLESPAIDNGTLSDVYQKFYDLYNVHIEYDLEGKSRPQDGDHNGSEEWDIGAYEYVFGDSTNENSNGNSNGNTNEQDTADQKNLNQSGCSCKQSFTFFSVNLALFGFYFVIFRFRRNRAISLGTQKRVRSNKVH